MHELCIFLLEGPSFQIHRVVFHFTYYRNITTAATALQKWAVENTFGLNL